MKKGSGGPWCPWNGHNWFCCCSECSIFWDTGVGQTVHDEWTMRMMERRRRHGDQGQAK